MRTTNCQKFKGESQNFLSNGINNIESKIDAAFLIIKKFGPITQTKAIFMVGFDHTSMGITPRRFTLG
ncbi:hypothetical protein LCGC14_2010460 [marine sediment metagenome]|uniref:Uncharacterized protein n=1 Tax=marine sediment metagenome TaxID=412755 RepID=A0A0F9F0G7_9ZZZZ